MQKRISVSKRLVNAAVIAAVAAGGLVVATAPASAAPNFQLPFPCGQEWRLNTWGHGPALDMVREPQSQTEGSPLVAPAAGRVNQSYLHGNAGHMIQIDHGDGHFTTYIHLQSRSVSAGDRVARGESIGRVGHTGETSNGVPHLHYEQGYDSNGDGRASWGFEGAERVTARFDGKAYGPGDGGEWRHVESRNCATPTFSDGGDFNADAVGDIAAVHENTGVLHLWNGTGTNSFGSAVALGPGWGSFSRPVTGDFTNDNRSDLAAVRDGTLYVWNGTGTNSFGSAIPLGPGWGPYADTLTTLGDITNDGRSDLAAVRDGTLYLWHSTGNNSFGAAIELGTGWNAYSRPAAGDFNNDGRSDLAAVHEATGTLTLWNSTGASSFGPAIPLGTGWGPYADTLTALGDINKDGRSDLAAVRDGTLHVWNGTGTNSFGAAVPLGAGWTPYF